MIDAFLSAFPDRTSTFGDFIVENDKVVAGCTASAERPARPPGTRPIPEA
jgi:hypothetical protein